MSCIYIVDSGIWIDLSRFHPIDISIYNTLWVNLKDGAATGTIAIPEEVYVELTAGSDDLSDWIKKLKHAHPNCIIPTNYRVLKKVTEVMANCPGLVDPDSSKNHADPFVVATGNLTKGVVVCSENARKHPHGPFKIPDACTHFAVRCIKYLEFAREYPWMT